MHDIAFYWSRWHGLPVENEDQAFEVSDACTHDKGYYLEYSGEEEMLHRSPPKVPHSSYQPSNSQDLSRKAGEAPV